LNSSSFAQKDFPDLRYITQAGGHMPVGVKQKLIDLLPGKDIYIMYGATEASARLSYLEPQYLSAKINSIGKAIPNVEIKVFNEEGVSVAVEEEGELVARGGNLMDHYWNNPEGTAQVLRNGWYYTGDIGFRDEDGFFFVTGRKRDMIKIGIYKVSAVEIEEILHRCPGILEAAVVGIHDDVLGEAACAFVVRDNKKNLSLESVLRFCDEHLSNYKVPKRVVFIENLPKNEAGKIMKQQLGFMPNV
jgi:acyl-CoA synthetase (AMP-forming)/AMP-acid ligase II